MFNYVLSPDYANPILIFQILKITILIHQTLKHPFLVYTELRESNYFLKHLNSNFEGSRFFFKFDELINHYF